ncbi:hypothetical protein BCR32DRAFT_277015 [Anaeromyces robustus]|uniref:Uncharacterized protein n=1 Tax=Anaeromyces robustus TaxID=1754192 RepID=A0A1Y1XFI3_9FUNG|nr:hypothetical protein BCR32DRAFT_277015 [Anaeromyces robustus]|eukprot:ORX84520.1 hypothetical protein BCR32DRAFT_277015 [Anaeromyces robustus]
MNYIQIRSIKMSFILSYSVVGITNIPCQGCICEEFVKKARDIFGNYPLSLSLDKYIRISSINNDQNSTSISTSSLISTTILIH